MVRLPPRAPRALPRKASAGGAAARRVASHPAERRADERASAPKAELVPAHVQRTHAVSARTMRETGRSMAGVIQHLQRGEPRTRQARL